MTKVVGSSGTPNYSQLVDDLSLRGAKAIRKMDVGTQDEIMAEVPGTVPEISQSFHGRLLRRRPAELAKLIGDTHLDTTTETSGRIADLKVAMSDDDTMAMATALADITKSSQTPPGLLERLVLRLELINHHVVNKQLAMVPGPLRNKIQGLADGDASNLPKIIGEALGQMAYKPLQDAVDT